MRTYLPVRIVRSAGLFALALCTGCATTPAHENVAIAAASQMAAPLPPPTSGSIFRDGQGVSLFEDQRARNVGDLLTVLLVESTDAKTSSATDTSKTTDNSISAPTIAGMPVTIHGVSVLSGSLDSKHSFAGAGDSSQSNKLNGSLTVTVVSRLPNGNLAVRGEKLLAINQGQESVRVEGIVRPADIAPDNSVLSSRIADARIAYGDNGPQGESNSKGWLARFFSSQWMPF